MGQKFPSCLNSKDEFEGNIQQHDCFIHIVDRKFHLEHDFIRLLGITAPHQIITIAVMTRGTGGTKGMDVHSEFIESFGDFENRPLATTKLDWRLRWNTLMRSTVG
ncbi:hypothetical protein TSMEX_003107 [Taenia solium]|eukprot:TsM_000660600 transcript=TsM_000660600 gene=TsM_000660600